jgi:hypothetical protein
VKAVKNAVNVALNSTVTQLNVVVNGSITAVLVVGMKSTERNIRPCAECISYGRYHRSVW